MQNKSIYLTWAIAWFVILSITIAAFFWKPALFAVAIFAAWHGGTYLAKYIIEKKKK